MRFTLWKCQVLEEYFKEDTMNLLDAIEILQEHQAWRRGEHGSIQKPSVIGEAIDRILKYFKDINVKWKLQGY